MKIALSNVFSSPKSSYSGIFYWWAWHVIVVATLLVAMTLSLNEPFKPSLDIVQALFPILFYLLLSLLIVPAAARSPRLFLALTLLAAVPGIGALYLIDRVAGSPVAPRVVIAAGVAALVAALVPYLAGKLRIAVIVLLGLLALAAIGSQWHKIKDARSGRKIVPTASYALEIATHSDLVSPPSADGGGIQGIGSGTMLVTGDGSFYWIVATGHEGRLSSTRLAIPAPADRKAYFADFPDPSRAPRLRVTDLLLEASARPGRLYVAHQHWDHAGRCYAMDLSVISLRWDAKGIPAASSDWKTLFRSRPCIRNQGLFDDSESGGQLAWAKDGGLLLSLGDFGFAGLDGAVPLSQDVNADYGKILRIDPATGAHGQLSIGHRNPEGLAVAPDGRIWEAEHGPQGGDEINLIVPGGNYGWPYVTYGAEYGTSSWPLDHEGRNHGSYNEPATAFVPSVATSGLMVIGGAEFPRWNGDLLVASLRTESLYRARTNGDRIMYVEAIPIGMRIRDLTGLPDGKILLWTDVGKIIEIRATTRSAFGRYCQACHQPMFGGAAGPTLKGIAGRPIASVPGYAYSPALKARKGVWDRKTLDSFLRDPAAFAPGTAMMLQGVGDKDRAEIVNELMESPN